MHGLWQALFPASFMNPSCRASQADEVPVALFFQNGKFGAFVKQSDLERSSIVPGIYRRFLFSHIPGRVNDDVVCEYPATG